MFHGARNEGEIGAHFVDPDMAIHSAPLGVLLLHLLGPSLFNTLQSLTHQLCLINFDQLTDLLYTLWIAERPPLSDICLPDLFTGIAAPRVFDQRDQ